MTKKTQISRRKFIGAAAAFSLPLFVPGRVLGKDGHFPPSETINVGLIGLGTRRSNVGHRPGARFCAYCDIDTRRLPKEENGVKTFQYYQGSGSSSGTVIDASYTDANVPANSSYVGYDKLIYYFNCFRRKKRKFYNRRKH